MRSSHTATILVSAALFAAPPLRPAICFVDDVPAATLLLPYFEVDVDDPNGINTLMSINNASADGVLAQVALWTDLGVATFNFSVYLTGYDVQVISLRDIFRGAAPRTASAGQDPSDTISPKGAFSLDVDFPSCAGQLPPPPIPGSFVTHLRAAHSGQFSSILNGCTGRNLGDGIFRGYVTVDVMNRCSLMFPGDPGYFAAGGTGDASNRNVLWGDYYYIDSNLGISQGDTLVHIEASFKNPETSSPGQQTFYGRFVNWSAIDNREPLSTHFASRYIGGGASTNTDFVVWRDPKVNQGAFPCGTLPSWYPLAQEQIVVFDEQEHPQVFEPLPNDPPFPGAAQRTRVDGPSLPVLPTFGWASLDLNTTVPAAGGNPPEDPGTAQAWMTTVMTSGAVSVGFDAIHLDSACAPSHAVLGPP